MAAAEIPEVRAEAKYVRTAPRKAQLVVAEIRGLRVDDARTMLAFMPRAAARDVEAVLKSAVANAEANHGLSGDDLYVSAAYVGYGPTLKRWRARARGRVGRIKKRTCHITIRLAPVEGAAALPAAREAVEPEAATRRTRRTTAEAPALAAVVEVPAAEPVPAEEAVPAEEKKPRRAPRKEAAEPAESVAGAEEAPKPRRSRTKAAERAASQGDEKPESVPRKNTEHDAEKES